MRYYYKKTDGSAYLSLRDSLLQYKIVEDGINEETGEPITHEETFLPEGYVEITEQEFEEHQFSQELTKEQLRVKEIYNQINIKKAELAATDYKCLKFIDGELTEEEYLPVKQHRAELRQQINELEELLK